MNALGEAGSASHGLYEVSQRRRLSPAGDYLQVVAGGITYGEEEKREREDQQPKGKSKRVRKKKAILPLQTLILLQKRKKFKIFRLD